MSTKLTQTELGEIFGLSAIEMGKKLIELNLRDKNTKLATENAISNELAKIVSYSKNDQDIVITIYNYKTVEYIKKETKNDIEFQSQSLIGKLKNIKRISEDDINGNKEQQIMLDDACDEFKEKLKNNLNNNKIMELFYKKVDKLKLKNYLEHFLN